MPGMVSRHRVLKRFQHPLAVVRHFHVYEIDDDDAAKVAQPQLSRRCLRRLEVGAVYGFFEIAVAQEGASRPASP
jgi:hypothetical protein